MTQPQASADQRDQGDRGAITSRDIEDVCELSPLQQGMLFHSLYSGDADTYLAQRSYIIDGPLDADVLHEAWQQAVDAHTTLRTSFHWEELDQPLQVVHRVASVTMERHDWSDIEELEQDDKLDRLLTEDRNAGFDTSLAPLQRLHLVRLGENRHGLIWTYHMLVVDGWSVPILVKDVIGRYLTLGLGGSPADPAPPYRNYIAWLQGQDLGAAKKFWTNTLSGRADAGELAGLLPADHQRSPGLIDERVVSLPPPLEAALRELAARHHVTLNTVLQAAWALVLQRFTGDTEVMFGCTTSGRPSELPEVDRMVGSFTNTLPVRVAVPGDGDIGSWLQDIQATVAAARRYEYSPLAEIKKWAGAPGPNPLFQTVTIFDNYPTAVGSEALGELSFRPVDAFEKTSVPLTVVFTPEPQSTLWLFFHRERFVPGVPNEILDCLRATLTALPTADRIASLAMATVPPDYPRRGEGAACTYPSATVVELIERQAQTSPNAIAALADDTSVSYRQLLARARRVADAVREAGAGPDDVVGVCAERSIDMVAGLVGTLLAGAAYLPLDPSLPEARLAFMVKDANAEVVLATRETVRVARESGAKEVRVLDELATADDSDSSMHSLTSGTAPVGANAAYVMYTSGSTGKPKGIVITHEAVVNRLHWMQDTFKLTPRDRVLQKTPFGFDVSVWELFWPLITGSALVLARPGGHQDPEYLAETIRRHAVTTAHFVPSMLQLFLDEPAASLTGELRRVVCSGEQLPYALVERFRSLLPHVELHNLYGPTEATVDVTWWDCAQSAPPGVIPIGGPISNTQAVVLDRRLLPVPDNVPGELYLGGIQLARGFVGRPALTAATFVAHPLAGPGGRLLRTGDKARRLPAGELEFLGRLDDQVKIRGYRIELGEIEQALAAHGPVLESVVVVREEQSGPRLAAYVTGRPDLDEHQLREHLRFQLPTYMLPATITVLPAMPLTHNGKLDRAALASRIPAEPARHRPVAPSTEREASIAAVYCDVLGLQEADVVTSFFDMGGDSFSAVRAVRRIEGASVGLLASHPSVRELAVALERPASLDRILLPLTEIGEASRLLICVPFGGGSAITYQPLAAALSPDTALFAVSLPGHELGGDPELYPMSNVADRCLEATTDLPDIPISVYGHCVGVALAVELVRRLEADGRTVDRLFLGASYPFTQPGAVGRTLIRSGFIGDVSGRPQWRRTGRAAEIAEMQFLQSLGGFADILDDDEISFLMRAFHHDLSIGRQYFSEHWPRGSATPPLAAPITVIVGTGDPLTPRYKRRYRVWDRFSSSVDLAEVHDGGHYFLQHQPEALARVIEADRGAAR